MPSTTSSLSSTSSTSSSPSEVETAQISYPTSYSTIGRGRHPRDSSSNQSCALSSSSWVLISAVVALVALASVPSGAEAWPLQGHEGHGGHSTEVAEVDEGQERSRSMAALVLATRDALPRVHYRRRRGLRRLSSRFSVRRRSSRAPRNLNTCGNEPTGTPVRDCNNIHRRL